MSRSSHSFPPEASSWGGGWGRLMDLNRLQIWKSLGHLDFPGGSDGKETTYNVVDLGLIPGLSHTAWPPFPDPLSMAGCSPSHLYQGIFPTQGSNPGLPHCRQTLYRLSHQGTEPTE